MKRIPIEPSEVSDTASNNRACPAMILWDTINEDLFVALDNYPLLTLPTSLRIYYFYLENEHNHDATHSPTKWLSVKEAIHYAEDHHINEPLKELIRCGKQMIERYKNKRRGYKEHEV